MRGQQQYETNLIRHMSQYQTMGFSIPSTSLKLLESLELSSDNRRRLAFTLSRVKNMVTWEPLTTGTRTL